ncbi:MAG TPA: glutamate racemase [Vicinamibacteria bacterium]|nr:glutamate racemase [Vicinamibacteria bacterium]
MKGGGAPGPIGLFDSGVGGLSVAREIRRALPAEDLLYVADTAYCPYGDRPVDQVRERALAVGRHLQEAGARLVVAACNTASGAALEDLRAHLSVPVVGLEPAVKTAVAATRSRRVGVMATSGTLRSERFARLVQAHGDGVQVVAQPCPGLADLIEEGHLEGEMLTRRLVELTEPLREQGVDVVVLGCTHYAFVSKALETVLGPGVTLVDSAPAIARRTAHLLGGSRPGRAAGGLLRVLTTGDPARVGPVVRRLWDAEVRVEAVRI